MQEGEWALIWGIGGGVATAAFEICRALGVRTIVTSGSDEKLAQAREWGADVGVNHHTADVVAAVKEATGKGVARRRRVGRRSDLGTVARGRAAGGTDRGLRRHERPEPAGAAPPLLVEAADRARLDAWARARTFSGRTTSSAPAGCGVHVDRVFPLSEIRAAHERLEAGEQLGKIVLSIPG